MTYRIVHGECFSDIPAEEYRQLWQESGSPAFYHPGFLAAAERFPMLPVIGTHYFTAWKGARLAAFLVVYQQAQPDPFGTLANSTGIVFSPPLGGCWAMWRTATIRVFSSAQGLRMRRRFCWRRWRRWPGRRRSPAVGC